MTTLDRAAAVKAERNAVVEFCSTLSDEDWLRPSRCPGWTVKDVIAHMGAASKGFFTPWVVGLMLDSDVEKHNDRDVEKRRDWEPARVFKEYVRWSRPAGGFLGVCQAPGLRSLPLKLAEVGTYKASLFASAITFDTGTHLRHDICGALGATPPPTDANRTAVTLEWMLAGLPTMSGDSLSWLTAPVELNLVGAGGGTWTIAPGGKKGRVVVTEGSAQSPVTAIEGDAGSFYVWGTGRSSWRDTDVSLKGDEDVASRFLDDMKII